MNDAVAAEPASSVADGITAGMLLRRAREAAGLHVAALAVSLKVPVRKLEALEGDQYEQLGDAVFVRGLASSVCRALKVDPQPILGRLPQAAAPRLVRDTDGLNAPFRAPGDGPAPSWIDQLTRPAYLAVFALLLGALVMVLLPTVHHEEKAAPTSVESPAAASASPVAPAASALVEPVANAATTTAMPSAAVTAPLAAVAPNPVASAAPAAAKVASAPVAVNSQPTSAPTPSAARPAAAASSNAVTGTVVIRAKGESWVEVTDGRGGVPLRKTLAPGESVGASGTPPLKITIGRADATEVQVRGKPFDLAPVSRENVARFEVK